MICLETTRTVRDLVRSCGREHDNRVYLRYEENDEIYDVTYRQFAAECEAIAAWTSDQDQTYGHKVQVGLLGSSSHHYLAVMLGVMSNGNVAVPLDIQMDVATCADCLNRSDVDILFYDWDHHALVEGVKDKCPNVKAFISLQHGKHVPCSDKILKEYHGRTVNPTVSEDDCAMILFTSGTTGRGKGVMLSNRNLIDNTFNYTDYDHPEKEVYLSVLPIHHVFCLNSDVLMCLRYGALLCLNRDMTKLGAHIQMFQPTMMHAVPMIAKALYNKIALLARQDSSRSIYDIKKDVLGKRFRRMICGGGYLTPELAGNYARIGVKSAQGYGMSECAPKISCPDWDRPDKVASVGKIVERCQVRIVDGEIQVKSPSVMMGYYKEPDKTAEAITEDGWLCTGDLGYVDEENFLYLTGRKKNLIILSNGENVAPEQLENMFEDDRLIEEILVFEEDDMICAEVYPNFPYAEAAGIADIENTVNEIVRMRNQELPTFKRIMRCQLREVPFEKTSSKKINRNRFFEKRKHKAVQEASVTRPMNELQQKLYDNVEMALGHTRFGIDTDLYEAGLDSLGSVMLLTAIHDEMKVTMTINDLMKHSSILKLEAFCQEAQNQEQIDYSVRPVYPLTNLQLYFAYVMRGNTTANLPFLYKLDQRVDLARLQASIEGLFRVHPELNDVIQMSEAGYQNFRNDDREVHIPITELRDAEWPEVRKGLLKPYLYTENEPLYHIGIYKTESANYLYFDVAHIIGDGVSMNILFEDLNKIYAGEEVKKDEYTFYEFILDEKARNARGVREENIRYYQNLMEGFKIRKSILNRKDFHDLDQGINAVLKNRFKTLNRKKIKGFCHQYGVSENVVFLTAYNYCISIFSNEQDTVSSSIHSGRTDSRWNHLLGPLFITYFFRYTNVPHETVPHLLQRCGRQIMETMGCNISNLHADEMFFQYQGDLLNLGTIGGFPAEHMPTQLDSLPFHLQVMSGKKGYTYELRYWENRFDRQQLEIFMEAMEAIITAMLTEPSVRRLKKHLPEKMFPKHYYVKASDINDAVGYELLRNARPGEKVKAYVFDDTCRKKPFGGWGNLYIMDHPTYGWTDKITNPYGPGMLYQTGFTARILPDGSIDILQNGGRTVMNESLMGRNFLNLQMVEDALREYEGIEEAEAFVEYMEGNKLLLAAEVKGSKEPDQEALAAWMEEKVGKIHVPAAVRFVQK